MFDFSLILSDHIGRGNEAFFNYFFIVQILGAEKALFRALKKKGNTPKYGLIFHSTFKSSSLESLTDQNGWFLRSIRSFQGIVQPNVLHNV